MIHNFFLDEVPANPDFDFARYYDRAPVVSFSNDLLEYIGDSLLWVPTHNPACSMKKQFGLNLCGITALKSEGAKSLYEISKAWSQLFRQSPCDLRLTGGYTWVHESAADTGEYEKLVYNRDEVIACFDLLVSACQKVSESNDASFIMHYGL